MGSVSLLGNKNILDLPKTAFLAASQIKPSEIMVCYDWAEQMRKEGRCVISGFSSHLEKDVLHFLLKGTQPIILVLARQMYKRVPEELQPLIDNGRLLVISTSTSTRQSKATAHNRNKYICEIADQIFFAGVDENSSLYPLREKNKDKWV